MAINDNTPKQGNDTNMAQAMRRGQEQSKSAPAQPQQTQETARMNTAASSIGFSSMGRLTPAPMGLRPESETLGKLMTLLTDKYRNNVPQNLDYRVIAIDRNNESSVPLSMIVVAVRNKQFIRAEAAFHVLILEASAPRFDPLIQQGQGTAPIEVLRFASTAYTTAANKIVVEKVSQAYPNCAIIDGGSTVVPTTFDVNDADRLHRLAVNALYAGTVQLDVRQPEFRDFNIKEAAGDASLVINATFHNPVGEDSVGNPRRQDVIVKLTANTNISGQQTVEDSMTERTKPVATATGFVDLIWDGAQQNSMYASAYGQQQQHRPVYIPRLVLTSLAPEEARSIGSVLLALACAATLKTNNAWLASFWREGLHGQRDKLAQLRDIGAINIEANVPLGGVQPTTAYGPKIPTTGDDFKIDHFIALAGASIRPELVVSLLVPDSGPDSYFLDVFVAAAAGKEAAKRAIIQAANELTNDLFGESFYKKDQAVPEVVVSEGNRILLGSYFDEHGVNQDILNIDTLAVANAVGEHDPRILADWSNSHLRAEFSLTQRLAERRKIISGILNLSAANFTGIADMPTFTPAFLDALVISCARAGLTPRMQTQYKDFNSQDRSHNRHLASIAPVAGAVAPSLYGGGYTGGSTTGQPVASPGYGNGNTRRW